MDNVIDDYPNGVEDIDTGNSDLDDELKNLNEEFKSLKSTNMKAVAYMLDSSVWKKKFVGEDNKDVKYVIGGPTIKQLFTSYNAKHKTSYEPNINETYNSDTWGGTNGYKIRRTSSESWSTSISGMLEKTDDTYVIQSTIKASWTWVASPSAAISSHLFDVSCEGIVYYDSYTRNYTGFRPLVCLSSDVHLKQTADGYEIVSGN